MTSLTTGSWSEGRGGETRHGCYGVRFRETKTVQDVRTEAPDFRKPYVAVRYFDSQILPDGKPVCLRPSEFGKKNVVNVVFEQKRLWVIIACYFPEGALGMFDVDAIWPLHPSFYLALGSSGSVRNLGRRFYSQVKGKF